MNNLAHVAYCENLDVQKYKLLLAQPAINLVLTKRAEPKWLNDLNYTLANQEDRFQFWSVNKGVQHLQQDLEDSLSQLKWESSNVKQMLYNSTIELATFFVELTGEYQPFISLRSIDTRYFKAGQPSVSKHFHVDTAALTLCCTYFGKPTEWTPNNNVIRKSLVNQKIQQDNEDDDTYLANSAEIYDIPRYSIGILKGEIRTNETEDSLEFLTHFVKKEEIVEFNLNKGLLHRGPIIKHGDRRLLLTISAMKIPAFMQG